MGLSCSSTILLVNLGALTCKIAGYSSSYIWGISCSSWPDSEEKSESVASISRVITWSLSSIYGSRLFSLIRAESCMGISRGPPSISFSWKISPWSHSRDWLSDPSELPALLSGRKTIGFLGLSWLIGSLVYILKYKLYLINNPKDQSIKILLANRNSGL